MAEEKNVGTFGNIFEVSSVLSKNNFKPFWETIRDYFFIVMVTTAVYMAFSVQPGQHFYCRPLAHIQSNLTAEDSTFVNAVCFSQYAKFEPVSAYAGPLALVSSLLVYVCIMIWLASPCVVDLFSKVRKIDNDASKSNIEIDALDKLIQEAMLKTPSGIKRDQTPEVLQVKEICIELWALRSRRGALTMYIARNAISLFLLGISALIPMYVWEKQDSLFECKIEINDYNRMVCIHMIAEKVQPSLIVFALSVGVQIFLQLVSLVDLLFPCFVQHDGQLVVHFSAYSRTMCSITKHIISKTLSDIQDENENNGKDKSPMLPEDEPVDPLPSLVDDPSPTLAMETTPLIRVGAAVPEKEADRSKPTPGMRTMHMGMTHYSFIRTEHHVRGVDMNADDIQRLKVLRVKVLNALGAKDFATYAEKHKEFFLCSGEKIIFKGCGCDSFNFNLHDVDMDGKSLLYYALKKHWWSGPNFEVMYHALCMTTDAYVLTRDKLVDDGRTWSTVERYLKHEYGVDDNSTRSLVDVLKKCENKGDFAKYVQMNGDGKFRFIR